MKEQSSPKRSLAKRSVLAIFIVLALVLAAWAPEQTISAAATQMTLTITNPMPKGTTITLSGPRSYNISVGPGGSVSQLIDAGKYKYSYAGCLGKVKTGNLKSKGATASLAIPPCKMATWVFFNPDKSQPVTITLRGWVNYSETVGPGQIKAYSWVAGNYQMTIRRCGKSSTFPVNVKGKKSWVFYTCQ